MKSLLLLLGYLAIILSYAGSYGSAIPTNKSRESPAIVSRADVGWFRRDHKPGQPYKKGKAYFGYELPDDKSGWVPTGSAKGTIHYIKAPKYRSINPVTGKLRKGTSYCRATGWITIEIPDDAECCYMRRAGMYCRTYEFNPQPMTKGIVAVVSNGRGIAGG